MDRGLRKKAGRFGQKGSFNILGILRKRESETFFWLNLPEFILTNF